MARDKSFAVRLSMKQNAEYQKQYNALDIEEQELYERLRLDIATEQERTRYRVVCLRLQRIYDVIMNNKKGGYEPNISIRK